jgi:hypothetical protein
MRIISVSELLFLSLTMLFFMACSSPPYRSLEETSRSYGYSERLVKENVYSLFYQGSINNTPEEVEVFWLKRALELCPNGYVTTRKDNINTHGNIRTPINGALTTIRTKAPRVSGQFKCKKN